MQIVFVQLRYSYLDAFVFLFVCSAFESHFDLSIYGLKLFTSLSALRWKVTRRRMNKINQRIIFFWLFCCGLETLHLRLNVFSAHALNHILSLYSQTTDTFQKHCDKNNQQTIFFLPVFLSFLLWFFYWKSTFASLDVYSAQAFMMSSSNIPHWIINTKCGAG